VFHGCTKSILGYTLAYNENFNLSTPFLIHGGFFSFHRKLIARYYLLVIVLLWQLVLLIMYKRGVFACYICNYFSLYFNIIDTFLRTVCTSSSILYTTYPFLIYEMFQ